ncbi:MULTISPECIES: 2TM domain-containing protein [Robiginitalea]|uniref:2TM domain-containing protein n=1 Tax=Robiginitalea TaxID=252306 RepID=UPI00234ABC79|nr:MULTISPECIES: 2TM domain-containing protein [unclassified Robiginitalea]MDC6354510.1 2TM domain-containing protein [Robiginitalea sp. PM2]MDC6374808.1 2TM domain-containing protein [Robiginitalea sp. SP8]
MFSKNKNNRELDLEQHEQVEYAQSRIRQKKRLYAHFVIFLIGSVFLIVINKILKYGAEYDWFLWAMLLWAFLLAIHLVNVFITNRFMGREWERAQRERLVRKQKERIRELESEIAPTPPQGDTPKKKAP